MDEVECRKIRPIGSQIPISTFKAKLYWQSLERANENNENDENAYEVDSVTDPGMHEELLRQKMLRLAIDEPQFLEILKERKRLIVLLRQMLSHDDDKIASESDDPEGQGGYNPYDRG